MGRPAPRARVSHASGIRRELAIALLLILAVAMAVLVSPSPAHAMTPPADCSSCHSYLGYSHYHLAPGQQDMPCYSLCHWEGSGPYFDYLTTFHEYDENWGNNYTGSDHRADSCGFCHSPDHPLIPQHTDAGTAAAHVNDTSDCMNCHGPTLYAAHDAYPTCGVCHDSADSRVRAAISSEDHSCGACHDINPINNHPGSAVKTWSPEDYYAWDTRVNPMLMEIGDNPYLPGVHGNYTANTAKCGVCHSVHRAKAGGTKLLNTAVATCAGCHQTGSTVTDVVVSWEAGGPHGSGDPASCLSVSCHLGNPHGAGGSQYTIVAAKLLNPAADAALAAAVSSEASSGISTADLNAEVLAIDGGWDESTRSAVRTGYTCNQAGCHVQTMLAVLERGWAEERFTSNDSGPSVQKTGHLSIGTPDGRASFSPVTSCVSCHDQTDSATAGVWYSTVSGYTFPHSQTAAGTSNVGTGNRAWLWMTIAGNAGGTGLDYMRTPGDKAKDGACLKCHRDVEDRAGIGLAPAGMIQFAWNNPRAGSWAEYWIRDGAGNLVSTGYGEVGVDEWDGWFRIRVPVSNQPYRISIEWLDAAWDPWVAYWTPGPMPTDYFEVLIDSEDETYTYWY
ncbi:MAG: hypothetical protein U1E26_08490 [Coriobacteriia bacterium]|nr:hypothetical protein [Coriobacteriia bacterium]